MTLPIDLGLIDGEEWAAEHVDAVETEINRIGRGVYQGHFAQVTDDSSTITSALDLFTVAYPFQANRQYRISTAVAVEGVSSGANFEVQITDGSNNVKRTQPGQVVPGGPMHFNPWLIVAPGSGTYTYKVRVVKASGPGNGQVVAGTSDPAQFLVEDLGYWVEF